MRNKLPLFWVKIFYYEYWPFWFFFLPLVPYWIYLAIRARSLTYFTAVNPGIEHSGVFGESKSDILRKIDPRYLPKTAYFRSDSDWLSVNRTLADLKMNFPIIIKPDVGERGSQVEKVNNAEELGKYLETNTESFIIQEFLTLPLELGVLFYRIPGTNKKGITSVVIKEFLTVTGDGKSTLLHLIKANERAHLQLEDLKKRFANEMEMVLPKGEEKLLQPIGNHCKGTKFLSGQHLINKQLVTVFDEIASTIEGFNFGRFDLKVSSVEDLMKGENIRIMELNGVTSEPGHIYDPKLNLLRAYIDVASNMKMMFRVSQQSRKLGARVTPAPEMLRLIRHHFGKKPKIQFSRVKNLSVPNALGGIQ